MWLLALLIVSPAAAQPGVIRVPGDYPTISEALAQVPDHTVIEIAAGDYHESLVVERPVTLLGEAGGEVTLLGTTDAAAIEIVGTHGVLIAGLDIIGGKYGIFVTHSQDVTIRDNLITGSRLFGIKVRLAAADILDNTVENSNPPYGQGIHITNTTQWPASRIIGNTVSGHAKSGIITNMAFGVRIESNTVMGNHQHGIAITEMSRAVVVANRVARNEANGIFIGDMSIARLCGNIVMNTRASERKGALYGNGILVDFHSEAELVGNVISANENHGIKALFGSRVITRANGVWGNGVEVSDDINIQESSEDSICEAGIKPR